jgi:CSLREA domain-containing protein
MMRRYGAGPCSRVRIAADVNRDGCIDVADVQMVAAAYTKLVRVPRMTTPPLLGPIGAPPARINPVQLAALAPADVTFTVNSTADAPDANTADGVCQTAAGACTLRAAIESANAHVGRDGIAFAIPGTGVQTIALATSLPSQYDLSCLLVADVLILAREAKLPNSTVAYYVKARRWSDELAKAERMLDEPLEVDAFIAQSVTPALGAQWGALGAIGGELKPIVAALRERYLETMGVALKSLARRVITRQAALCQLFSQTTGGESVSPIAARALGASLADGVSAALVMTRVADQLAATGRAAAIEPAMIEKARALEAPEAP